MHDGMQCETQLPDAYNKRTGVVRGNDGLQEVDNEFQVVFRLDAGKEEARLEIALISRQDLPHVHADGHQLRLQVRGDHLATERDR